MNPGRWTLPGDDLQDHGNINLDLSVIALKHLPAFTIAAIARTMPFGSMFLIVQMPGHFTPELLQS